MALRILAAKLKEKIPAAVQRVFTSSRAPATSSRSADLLDPEIRQAVEELVNLYKKNRRDEALARATGFGLAAVSLSIGYYRLKSEG